MATNGTGSRRILRRWSNNAVFICRKHTVPANERHIREHTAPNGATKCGADYNWQRKGSEPQVSIEWLALKHIFEQEMAILNKRLRASGP